MTPLTEKPYIQYTPDPRGRDHFFRVEDTGDIIVLNLQEEGMTFRVFEAVEGREVVTWPVMPQHQPDRDRFTIEEMARILYGLIQ